MAEPSKHSVRVRIHGKVQGVWFRAWAVREATALGLSGWVRNRSDGTVEAVFAGDAAPVRAMVARCRVGPPTAEVARVEETLATDPVEPGFGQRPTR
jgi:acylphosphatase